MSKDEQVILTREEARLVDEALGDYLDRLSGSATLVDEERRTGFRLLVKLTRVLPGSGLSYSLSDWMLPIMQRTFAPPPAAAPAKKTAPARTSSKKRARAGKAAASISTSFSAGARHAGASVHYPSRRVPAAASAAPDAGSPTGSFSPGDVTTAKLTGSAARRLGGLRRARQAAADKGDNIRVSELDRRIGDLQRSAAAVHAHS
jgi:hypothetical protein